MIKEDKIKEALQGCFVHVIPVGGKEPQHIADASCWCHPLNDGGLAYTHNAQDCREVYERIHESIRSQKEIWISVRSRS